MEVGLSRNVHILPIPANKNPVAVINKNISTLDIFTRIVNATPIKIKLSGHKVHPLLTPLQTVASKADTLEMCISPGSVCLARSPGVAKMEETCSKFPPANIADEVYRFVLECKEGPVLLLVDEAMLLNGQDAVDLQRRLAAKSNILIYSKFTQTQSAEVQLMSDDDTASYHSGSDNEVFQYDSE